MLMRLVSSKFDLQLLGSVLPFAKVSWMSDKTCTSPLRSFFFFFGKLIALLIVRILITHLWINMHIRIWLGYFFYLQKYIYIRLKCGHTASVQRDNISLVSVLEPDIAFLQFENEIDPLTLISHYMHIL